MKILNKNVFETRAFVEACHIRQFNIISMNILIKLTSSSCKDAI